MQSLFRHRCKKCFCISRTAVAEWFTALCYCTHSRGFKSHQCFWIQDLQPCGLKRLSGHADFCTFRRCHTRGESEDPRDNKARMQWIYLGFEMEGRCPKLGISVAPQRGLVFSKNLKENVLYDFFHRYIFRDNYCWHKIRHIFFLQTAFIC